MLQALRTPCRAHMVVDGRSILCFAGSGYLSLSQPEIIEAGVAALREQGPASQLPRHYGYAQGANLDCEATARDFFAAEAAMYFATGYLFGLLAMTGLSDDYDAAVLDELAHYSLQEGARAAGKPVYQFRHRDPAHLAEVVDQLATRGLRPLIATDGMFATTGAIAPLAAYKPIADAADAWLVVDESHAFGVLGGNGRGSVEREGVAGDRVLAGGSLGKAFSAYGGLAVGSQDAIDRLWGAPAARGAAAGMTSGAAMSSASLRYLSAHPERLARLRQNVGELKQALLQAGFPIEPSEAPVAAFAIGDARAMQFVQSDLLRRGILVVHSRYIGSGPEGLIRCAILADHEPDDFDRLTRALQAAKAAAVGGAALPHAPSVLGEDPVRRR